MFINVIDWKECGEYITIKVKKSNDLTKNYKKNAGNMKGKKILTGLLCAAVVGNLVAGVAPGMMCDVSAASAQTSTEQKKVVQTTKKLEQKRYNGVPGYQYKDIYATERVTIKESVLIRQSKLARRV